MQLLDRCLELCRDIKGINEMIEEINASLYTPKNQIISDMPKGKSAESVTDKLLEKKERLTAKKEIAEMELQATWDKVISMCIKAKVTKQQIQLLYLRFHEGKPWKKCTYIMQKKYGFWNDNKSFREYRSVLSKLHNEEQQTG